MAQNSVAAAERLSAHLRELEQLGSERAAALRAADAPPPRQQGLLFRLADYRLLTPVERLLGVWPLPRAVTAVPGTARWVLGVASHRGELLPLYNLRGLLLADYEGMQRRGIALVVPGASGTFGAVVDAVLGLRRTLQASAAVPQDVPALSALVTGACDCVDGTLPVVDPAAVEALPGFASGALIASSAPPQGSAGRP